MMNIRSMMVVWAAGMLSTLFPSCSGPHPTPGPQPGDSIAVADSALRQHLLAAEDSITYEQREGRYL